MNKTTIDDQLKQLAKFRGETKKHFTLIMLHYVKSKLKTFQILPRLPNSTLQPYHLEIMIQSKYILSSLLIIFCE